MLKNDNDVKWGPTFEKTETDRNNCKGSLAILK